MEHTVVRPDSIFDLFINTDTFSWSISYFVVLRCSVEESVLRETLVLCDLRLIYLLWIIGHSDSSGLVMPFVDKCRPVVFEPISIRCIATQRHQNYGMSTSDAEVHAAL